MLMYLYVYLVKYMIYIFIVHNNFIRFAVMDNSVSYVNKIE